MTQRAETKYPTPTNPFRLLIRHMLPTRISTAVTLAWLVIGSSVFHCDTLVRSDDDVRLDDSVQPLEMNVFLRDWHVMKPFSMAGTRPKELDFQYFENESKLRAGNVRIFGHRVHTWQRVDSRLVDLRQALGLKGRASENLVTFAWTQFKSETDQKLTLGVSHDDACMAWLNDEEVLRQDIHYPSSLDQSVAVVDVKKGVNTLLLKISQGTQDWDFAARFRPAEINDPYITFQAMPDSDRPSFPVVKIELLGRSQKQIASYRCSGTRSTWGTSGCWYRLYTRAPETEPSFVRLTASHPGLADFDRVYPWSQIKLGNVKLEFQADAPLRLLVRDVRTNLPIEDARVWNRTDVMEGKTNSKGLIAVNDLEATARDCWVHAPGYIGQKITIDFPRRKVERCELVPGGATVTGIVTSRDGTPLAGAKITTKTSKHPQFTPSGVTDENGRFTLSGFTESKPNLTANVSCRGYTSKSGLEFTLAKDKPAEVVWSLDPAALIVGKVIDKTTGQPVSGARLVIANGRSSNPRVTARTNALGEYELPSVPPGEVALHALSDNHGPILKRLTATVGNEIRADFTMDAGITIAGTVKEPGGQPISGARVIANTWHDMRVFTRDVRTDSEGRFRMVHMPDSGVQYYALKTDYVSKSLTELKAGDDNEITLAKQVYVTFQVSDQSTGQPIPGLTVVQGYKFPGQSNVSWQSGNSSYLMRNYDAQRGELKLPANEGGNYTQLYRFRGVGFQERTVEIPTSLTEDRTIEVKLEKSQTVKGRLIAADSGKPLSGVAVAIVNESDQLRLDHYLDGSTAWDFLSTDRFSGVRTTTDAGGVFEFDSPSDTEPIQIVFAEREGGYHFVNELPKEFFTKNDGKTLPAIPYPEQGIIQGAVQVAGTPIANAQLYVSRLGLPNNPQNGQQAFGYSRVITTDAQGNFNTGRMGPGQYQISRIARTKRPNLGESWHYLNSQQCLAVPGENKTLSFDVPEGFSISGVVLDPDGKPLSNTQVTARSSRTQQTTAVTVSDANGRFTLEHVPGETHTLQGEHYPETRDPQQGYRVDYTGNELIDVTESIDGFEFQMNESGTGGGYVMSVPSTEPITGTLVPNFEVAILDSPAPIRSSELIGKTVALCFWHTWSPDIDSITSAYKKLKDNDQVVFLTVHLGQEKGSLDKMIKDQDLPFPIAYIDMLSMENDWYQAFGSLNSQFCYVIGPDGRFAAERLASQQLVGAVEKALGAHHPTTKQPNSQLKVSLSIDGSDRGVYGAKLSLQAIDESGKVIQKARYTLGNTLRDLTWSYAAQPKVSKLVVKLTGQYLDDVEKVIDNPTSAEQLTIPCESPRRITGRVLSSDKKEPVAGLPLTLYGFEAGIQRSETDSEGRFSIGCFPGSYQLAIGSDGQYAVATTGNDVISVPSDRDLRSKSFTASPAVTLRGTVRDPAGELAPHATVRIGVGTVVETNDQGEFTLPGVASIGTTMILAMVDNQYGALNVTNPTGKDQHEIVIGQGFENLSSEPAAVSGQEAPELTVITLEGETVAWSPEESTNHCLLFCELWHPKSADYLAAATELAEKHDAVLDIISIDWSENIAAGWAKRNPLPGRFFIAEAGGLKLSERWGLSNRSLCVVVSPEREIIEKLSLKNFAGRN